MERLKVQYVQEIIRRLRLGQSERSIVRDLGCARDTVRRYAKWATERGFTRAEVPLPSLEELDAGSAPLFRPRSTNISTAAPLGSVIEELLDHKLDTTAILTRLQNNHGYTGSYSSVRRYIAQIRPKTPEAVVRLETPPGRQAQVDFGSIGKLWDPVERRMRSAHCFVMTLSWSRHQFVRFVFDQKTATWLECHRLAFEAFGGVPQEIVIDNLKAAVLTASMDDPVLSQPYSRFALHYGFLVHPCRPATPQHKGKVESGVKYVQRGFLGAVDVTDIDDANRKVQAWVSEVAGLRTHGTTRTQPMARFLKTERESLMALPSTPCDLETVVVAKVHRDCHVQVQSRYYSVPHKYVGKKLDVFVYHQTVQIFDGVTLVVTHERASRKGDRVTRDEHYPEDKSRYLHRTRAWCEEQALAIGPKCREAVDQLLADRPLDRLRAVQGLLTLAQRYAPSRVEAACARALTFGDVSYRRIKTILTAGTDLEPLCVPIQLELIDTQTETTFAFARTGDYFFRGEESIR